MPKKAGAPQKNMKIVLKSNKKQSVKTQSIKKPKLQAKKNQKKSVAKKDNRRFKKKEIAYQQQPKSSPQNEALPQEQESSVRSQSQVEQSEDRAVMTRKRIESGSKDNNMSKSKGKIDPNKSTIKQKGKVTTRRSNPQQKQTSEQKELPSQQDEEFEQDLSSDEEGSSEQSSNEISDEEDSSEQESQSSVAQQNYAVRQMKFRERRGTKMNYLMNKKKEEQEDSFWQNQGMDYFGINGDNADDDEDDGEYEQSSSGRDEFDSDFDQTESKHSSDDSENQNVTGTKGKKKKLKQQDLEEVDEAKVKEKKRRQDLMRKIQAPAPNLKKPIAKKKKQSPNNDNDDAEVDKNDKIVQEHQAQVAAPEINTKNLRPKNVQPTENVQTSEKNHPPRNETVPPGIVNRYIHQACTQQQLLGEAAQTEYINWISLQKLISLQSDKKHFDVKSHYIEGDKIIYRDRINKDTNQRQVSYEMVGVDIENIGELTEVWLRSKHEAAE